MSKNSVIASLFISLIVLFLVSSVAGAQQNMASSPSMQDEKIVRVGILTKQVNVIVNVDGDYDFVDDKTGLTIASFSAHQKSILSILDGTITVNGIKAPATMLKVVAKEPAKANIEINRRHYRGSITIQHTMNRAGLTVINTLGVEEYLYGVISKEISPDWPIEAVKAQAVAARSYALANLNKHQKEGFDICSTTDCQVYGGRDSESERVLKAVNETKGEVVVYNGQLIKAYFHSSSGGYTENAENVWGMHYPYLQGVVDFDQQNPHFKWEKEVSSLEIEKALLNAGYQIGTLQAIHLSRLQTPPIAEQDRGISGRVKTLQMIGSQGSVELSGTKLRSILALNSTLFDIDVIVAAKKVLDFAITDSAGDRENKHVELNLPPRKEKGLLTDKENIRRISGRADEKILITGYGWGHGVGLSQWGAKAMAEKGPVGDSTYYKAILKHYYQGVEIEKWY